MTTPLTPSEIKELDDEVDAWREANSLAYITMHRASASARRPNGNDEHFEVLICSLYGSQEDADSDTNPISVRVIGDSSGIGEYFEHDIKFQIDMLCIDARLHCYLAKSVSIKRHDSDKIVIQSLANKRKAKRV
jgi:hypothetical protein